MYTLNKAKEEIDNVAKHATDMATHMIGLADDINARLDAFKTEIMGAIEQKFAELARTIHGETETVETSAVHDLGAKVSMLMRPAAAPASGDMAHDPQPPHVDEHHGDQGHQPEHHDHY